MTITLELPPEIEERFLAQARVRGMSIDAYVKEFLSRSTIGPAQATILSPNEMNRLLDEAAELVPDGTPLSDYAMSREIIYTRENEWWGLLVLADTNILLRRIHRTHPQHRLTRDALMRIAARGDIVCVTPQNLIECWAVCTRPVENNGLGLILGHASRVLSRIEHAALRLGEDDSVYSEWRRLMTNYVRRVWEEEPRCPFSGLHDGAWGDPCAHLQC